MKLKNNTIIYVGTTSSGGVKLDCNFINDLAFLVAANFPEWIIELVGINKDFFINQISGSLSSNIIFSGYVQREVALKKMRYAKVGLVLYGNHGYHQFPIKIVEYAASGLSILASDTPIHRRVLGSDKCLFYEVQSPISAFASLKSLLDNTNTTSELNFNLSNWVKKLTYTNRVTKVLELVLKESSFN
jgi:glycosyltransferase involved in cell wall biosynthesis